MTEPAATSNPVDDALFDVYQIARAVAGRTGRITPGKARTRAYLEGLIEDSERQAAAARRALAEARGVDPSKNQPSLFEIPPAPPVEPPGPPLPERDPRPVERARVQLCDERTCRAPMVYLDRGDGQPHPYDAGTVRHGERKFDRLVHVSHFHTCTEPDRFRGGAR